MVNIQVGHHVVSCCILIWLIHCMGSATAECALDVSSYHGPHIGCQLLSWVFSPTCKERLKHRAHWIKDTEMLDILNGVGIY